MIASEYGATSEIHGDRCWGGRFDLGGRFRAESAARDEDKTGVRLKRSQIEEILKADREKSIEDAAQIARLTEELKADLEKNDKSVLSVAALRKAEEIEKLAKRIRGRFRRY
jgi:hypothetical protein